MTRIVPFHATSYNTEKIRNLSQVIAPPYDQISNGMLDELYQRNPHNFVRLIFGKIFSDDNDTRNRYTRSAEALHEWLNEKILITETAPAFFAYEQNFSLKNGPSYTRLGIVGLMQVEPFGKNVLPHEQTFSKPKADRLNLMKACKANFEHVFFLYDDPQNQIRQHLGAIRLKEPLYTCKDDLGTLHTLWGIWDAPLIQTIQTFFEDKKLLIADGHHRYETSVQYQKEMNSIWCDSTSTEAPFNFRLGTFVSLQDPGLIILPTHRVIKELSPPQRERLEKELPNHFVIQDVSNLEALLTALREKPHTFGFATKNRFQTLVLKESYDLKSKFPETPEALRNLDVFLLHQLILDRILQLPHSELDRLVSYVRWPEDALSLVTSGSHQAAFFLNAVKPIEVNAISQLGVKMPHKSTDFYPKLWSGIVFYKMEM